MTLPSLSPAALRKRAGFSLLEMLLVLSMSAALLGLIVPAYRQLQFAQELDQAKYQFLTSVQYARTNVFSRVGDSSLPWAVSVDGGVIAVDAVHGATPVAGIPGRLTFALSPSIRATTVGCRARNRIVFLPGNARAEGSCDFIFTHTHSGKSVSVRIDAVAGTISSFNVFWVCTDPGNVTQQQLQVNQALLPYFARQDALVGERCPQPEPGPPQVAITQPGAASALGANATVTAHVMSNPPPQSVEFQRNLIPFATLTIPSATPSPSTFAFITPWSMGHLRSGAESAITAIARNALGVGTSMPVHVVVDTVAPTVSIASPVPAATIGANATIMVSARDVHSSIARVDVRHGTTLIGSIVAAPYSISWDTAGLNGPQTITATAVDAAGNTSTASVDVTVDSTPPTGPSVTIMQPANGADITASSVTVSVDLIDPNSSVSQIEFYQSALFIGAVQAHGFGRYSLTWHTNHVPRGTVALTAIARGSEAPATSPRVLVNLR